MLLPRNRIGSLEGIFKPGTRYHVFETRKYLPTIRNPSGRDRVSEVHFTCITAGAIITKPRGIHDTLIARSAHNTILDYDTTGI